MVRAQLAVIVAVFSVAVAGCTVAIPAADHFPEARDSQVAEVGVDAADAVDAAVKPDATARLLEQSSACPVNG